MNRDQIKDYIRGELSAYLDIITTKKGRQYICPICNSGNKANNTPALSVNGDVFKCFSCNAGGDIFSLIALQNNLDVRGDFGEVLNIACNVLGIDNTDNTQYTPKAQHTHSSGRQAVEKAQKPIPTVNYKSFLQECKNNAAKTDYLYKRGLTEETINRFNLGFITSETLSKYKEPCNLSQFRAGEITIPYNEYEYFITRATNIETDGKSQYIKWKKPKTEHAGAEPIFNRTALQNGTEPVFIVEAPICAMSIEQVGGKAVAMGGTGADKLITEIDRLKAYNRVFIIALDNDKAGIKATESLTEQLKTKGIAYITFAYKDGIKDINAYLMADKKELRQKVQEAITQAEQITQPTQYTHNTESTQEPQKPQIQCASSLINDFVSNMKRINTPPTSSGFKGLDKELDGGLYEGLYIIGAVSSLGKTTFVLQIADQIAKGGRDVLIFSLEMGAFELIAKSLSRETYKINKLKAKTVRGITDQSRYKFYDECEKQMINGAIVNYRDYAKHIFIQEGIGDIGAVDIVRTVQEHITTTGNTPIVIVDYLQILAPYNERLSDKQNTDKAVLELKRMSRDYKTPVIAISSFNRESYNADVKMSAFKESGAIEYGADVLIGLQPAGMKQGGQETLEEYKSADIRDTEAKILKNRNGKTGGKLRYNYNPRFNIFEEKIVEPKEENTGNYNPFKE